MATIKNLLRKEVFEINNERLLCVCHVEKLFKKKKSSFLCVIQSNIPPKDTYIVQIKQNDKHFKRKHTWNLSELKLVDGKSTDNDNQDLDLHLDKIYRWSTSNLEERRHFISVLFQQTLQQVHRPEFKNIPQILLKSSESTPNLQKTNELNTNSDNISDYQAITEKEQHDLDKLISGCEFAISNAEAFVDIISRDLSLLDGENVQCVLASEVQIESLMTQIENAIDEANRIEDRLEEYDRILCHVRDTMEKMEKKNSLIEIANKNNQKLLFQLQDLIQKLDLSHEHQLTLVEPELTSPNGLKDAFAAASALRNCLNADIHPGLMRLNAVQEQFKRFEKLRDKFSHTLSRQLNNLFIHLGNEKMDQSTTDLQLSSLSEIHKELLPFSDLMHWTKSMDFDSYRKLRRIYTDSMGKLYERNLKQFFETALHLLTIISPTTTPIVDKQQQQQHQQQQQQQPLQLQQNVWLITNLAENSQGLGLYSEREKFDAILEKVLLSLEPVCLTEQKFCVKFFQLDVVITPSVSVSFNSGAIASNIANNKQQFTDHLIDADMDPSSQKIQRQVNEEVRKAMSELFSCLEDELLNFLTVLEQKDPFYCMFALVRLTQHVLSAQDTGSFLSVTFGSLLVQIKRNFDRFMRMQIETIRELKMTKKMSTNLLPYVRNFEQFANLTETIFKNERRVDLDKWYLKLMDAIIEAINMHAIQANSQQNGKIPTDVIRMENYHRLYAVLRQLKIPVLEQHKNELKQKYNDALNAYVTLYFGRPLEKLNQFFEGVEARVASGVKISEISYQLAFSKQELRKVIQQYPKREVKHGLQQLYRKVEKHLSDEENLLQVVWRAMQEEFIRQYKHLEELIQKCYPGSMITLDFTIDNILEFFSEIAQSH